MLTLRFAIVLAALGAVACGRPAISTTDGGTDDSGLSDGFNADLQFGDARRGDGRVRDGRVGDGRIGDARVGDGRVSDGILPDTQLPDSAAVDTTSDFGVPDGPGLSDGPGVQDGPGLSDGPGLPDTTVDGPGASDGPILPDGPGLPDTTVDGPGLPDINPPDTTVDAGLPDTTVDMPPAPSCSDGILNQDESDTDCGGVCPKCSFGQSCNGGNDCNTGLCESGSCAYGLNCQDLMNKGVTADGDYVTSCSGTPSTELNVFCDMTLNGGGWTGIRPDVAVTMSSSLTALVAAPTAGVDSSGRPFTQDGNGDHSYIYEFSFSCGFSEFFLRNYTVRANALAPDTSDANTFQFVMPSWLGYSGFHGDIGFGVAPSLGPITSLAAVLGGGVSCTNCTLAWPAGTAVYNVGGSATVFRIGWGEAGPQAEGWFPWWSGMIMLR